jgi:hypothetical protein
VRGGPSSSAAEGWRSAADLVLVAGGSVGAGGLRRAGRDALAAGDRFEGARSTNAGEVASSSRSGRFYHVTGDRGVDTWKLKVEPSGDPGLPVVAGAGKRVEEAFLGAPSAAIQARR